MTLETKNISLGVVMDPIHNINFKKDSTLAMLLEATNRNYQLFYMELGDLYLENGEAWASMHSLEVFADPNKWFSLSEPKKRKLSDLNVILMRKDPPFDIEYIYATYLLEYAERQGALIVNKPQSLRDANEKLFTQWFPQCCPPTLVTRQRNLLKEFIATHQKVILKILDGMGGSSIFLVDQNDPNLNVICETLSHNATRYFMAQKFIPEIFELGDKRILMINGKPFPYALARKPQAGEIRGNLAQGGKGIGVELTARDYWICNQIGEELKNRALLFVGIDVIGEYLTEINVTSPTCIREIDAAFGTNISATFLNCLEERLTLSQRLK